MRLIDADKVMKLIPTEEYNARQIIAVAPTVEAEPTYEQVIEYCRKRRLIIVTYELFNALKELNVLKIQHGHWIDHKYKEYPIGRYECSVCGAKHDMDWYYCPTCGAKMDEVNE